MIVEQSAVSTDPTVRGSIEHARLAAAACLDAAGVAVDDVDVLINVGVYRDRNIVEPANAALIQQALGMHPDYLPGSGRSTFSLDLRNGACGVLSAVQAAGALLATGSAERVLVVSADAHPSQASVQQGSPDGFPYRAGGAALLLRAGLDPDAGFGTVHLPPSPARTAGSGPAVTGYLDLATMGTNGQRLVTVDVDPDARKVLLDTAVDAVRGCPDRPENAVLVTTNPWPGFAAELAARTGFTRWHCAAGPDAASSALALAFHQLVAGGLVGPGEELLLVAAGSGPVAGCARYRVPVPVGVAA